MKKINFTFIPPHLNCHNCGDCCGIVPISEKEYNTILNYCLDNKIKPLHKETNNDLTTFECVFRDNENKKCLIYPVRPTLCKLMGVSEGMKCKSGNTYEFYYRDLVIDDIKKYLFGMIELEKELLNRLIENE